MKALAPLCTLALAAAACGDPDHTREPCDPTIVGNICTIAGSGENGYAGDDGDALDALMSLPQDTLHTADGTMYVLDWNNHRIRKLMADGTLRHVAGRGELGGTLDDPANDDFNHPTGMTLTPDGTRMVVAAWHNSKLRTLDLATGAVVDTCGDGRRAYFGDGGPAMAATLDLPASVAYAPDGDLVIMDQANQVIRAINPTGTIRRIAGQCVIDAAPPAGPGACAEGIEPIVCPQPGSGRTTCGAVTTCGLPCTPGYAGDDGDALELRMSQPFGQSADPGGRIVYDPAGNLYFADPVNAIIRKIDPGGVVTRFAGTAPVAGVSQTGHTGDGGPATSATLYNPVDLALDSDGTMYVSDVYNHCVRAIASDGTIRTAAGICGDSGSDGDHGAATLAHLKRPYGVEVHGDFLYISDTGNNVVRAVRLR
jgi:DNA-binding beta-propeller fold protein YncE